MTNFSRCSGRTSTPRLSTGSLPTWDRNTARRSSTTVPQQQQLAERSKAALAASGKFDQPIATEITPASTFYPAERYHQEYYLKNPDQYKRYKIGSGRAAYLDRVWGPSEESSSNQPAR